MGYPTSVFSPAARSNGQTIDAAHVGDLQTEMTAVQNALLGTITHSVNISGASTLATLQAAASTFTVRPVEPPPHLAKVFLGSTATLGSSAASTITWDSQDILTNSSMHSLVSNQERLTPQSTGVYLVAAQVGLSSTEAGLRRVAVIDSSNVAIADAQVAASSRGNVVNISGFKRFDALGGYIRCLVEQVGASTLSISTGYGGTWMSLTKL